MSEQTMRRRIIRALKPLDAISVENSAYPGTPDVNYIDGWIELKWLRSWPKKKKTPVRIDHFTPQQRAWLKRRWFKKGNAHLLLQVGKEWLLFEGDQLANIGVTLTREQLYDIAAYVWPDGLKDENLRKALT